MRRRDMQSNVTSPRTMMSDAELQQPRKKPHVEQSASFPYHGYASQGHCQSANDCDDEPSYKLQATTTLLGSSECISQATFLKTISAPGADQKDTSELFVFRKPRQRFERLNASSILKLTSKQHDVLYALSGCSDVMSVMSRITDEVRQAVDDIFGIDKNNLRTWFKNRGGAQRSGTKEPGSNGKRLHSDADAHTSKAARSLELDAGSDGAAGDRNGARPEPGTSTSSDQSNHAMDVLPACQTLLAARADVGREFATTKLRGTSEVITQDAFVAVIRRPGAAQQELSELFEFRRPRQSYKRANASALLNLTPMQHDALYALCGCSDVVSVASMVKQEVRDAVCEVYSIDKASLSIWFKNRRQIARKPLRAAAAAPSGTVPGQGLPTSMAAQAAGRAVAGAVSLDNEPLSVRLPSTVHASAAGAVSSGADENAWRQCGSTKLLGGTDVISQAVYALIIKSPGVAQQELSDLFVYVRLPPAQYRLQADLSPKQQDALFALAGCSDVVYSASRVLPQVRASLSQVYGIDEYLLKAWFCCFGDEQQPEQHIHDLTSSVSYLLPSMAPRRQAPALEIQPLVAAREPTASWQLPVNSCSLAVPCTGLDGVQRYVILPQSFDIGAAAELFPAAPVHVEQGQQGRAWASGPGFVAGALPVGQHQLGRCANALTDGDRVLFGGSQMHSLGQALSLGNGSVIVQGDQQYLLKAPIQLQMLSTALQHPAGQLARLHRPSLVFARNAPEAPKQQ